MIEKRAFQEHHVGSGIRGLCGWAGSGSEGADQRSLISRMTAGLDSGELKRAVGDGAVIAGIADVYSDQSLLTAVDGRPRWRSERLRAEAREGGHAYALAMGFLRMERDVLSELSGEFSLVIIKARENEVILAVDRMGVRPLAYAIADGMLVFGSTTDSVRAHPAVRSTLNPQALFDYLFFGFIPSPITIYCEQRKLLAGQYVHYRDGEVSVGRHWRPVYADRTDRTDEDLCAQLRSRLDDAVRLNLSDRPTGAFLSGGLDSSTICGILGRQATGTTHAFSIGFDVEGYDEIAYARAAARQFGLTGHEYYVTPKDVLDVIPILTRAYDEPFGNASAIPTYCCARMARESGVEVLLAGDGGDELFAGNERYAKQALFNRYSLLPRILREGILEPLAAGAPGGDRLSFVRKLRSFIRQANIPLPERLQSYNLLLEFSVDEIFEPDLAHEINPRHPFDVWEETYQTPETGHPLNRMLYLDWKHTLADCDLRKVNRMCEQAGVEVRYPMLDEGVVSLSMQIPADMKMKGNRIRDFYRLAFRDFLPPEVLDKRKHGFGLPFGIWLTSCSELQSVAYDAISSLKARRLIREDWLDWLIDRHRNEHAIFYGPKIWWLMMLELWLQERSL